MFEEVIAHGMWGGALISTVLGTEFPGPGTIYISQTFTNSGLLSRTSYSYRLRAYNGTSWSPYSAGATARTR